MSTGACVYRFSAEEIMQLALFLRRYEGDIPPELQNFFSFLESGVYSTMTIEEAERFFNER